MFENHWILVMVNGCHRACCADISTEVLTVNDLYDVLEELHGVRAKWHDLGGSLKVKETTLAAIKAEHRDNPNACLRETLSHWLRQVEPRPCWNAIVAALRKSMVDEPQLAQTLETKHCSGMCTAASMQPALPSIRPFQIRL